MCSSVCAWWEPHYPPQAQNKPSILKRPQKRWPVLVSGGPGAAGSLCAGDNEQGSGGSWHRCATGRGLGWGHCPGCVHGSPHTGPVFPLGHGLKGPLVTAKQRRRATSLLAASWPELPGIIPFLSPNTTAEMSSSFCSAGICQLGGYKDSIHGVGDRHSAPGKALRGDGKWSSVKLWTLQELLFVFRSGRTGERVSCVDHVFSWGCGASSGLVFKTADQQQMAFLLGQCHLYTIVNQLCSLLDKIKPTRNGFIFRLALHVDAAILISDTFISCVTHRNKRFLPALGDTLSSPKDISERLKNEGGEVCSSLDILVSPEICWGTVDISTGDKYINNQWKRQSPLDSSLNETADSSQTALVPLALLLSSSRWLRIVWCNQEYSTLLKTDPLVL